MVPYCTIKATRTESEPLPDILKEEISFDFSLQSNPFTESGFTIYAPPFTKWKVKLTQHAGSDVDTGPEVSFVIKDLT